MAILKITKMERRTYPMKVNHEDEGFNHRTDGSRTDIKINQEVMAIAPMV